MREKGGRVTRPSETPESDAVAMALHGKRLATGGWWVEAEFSRKLERERIQLRCEVVTLKVAAQGYMEASAAHHTSPWDVAVLRNYNAAKQRLEAALSENVTAEPRPTNPDNGNKH
jgi:hypothetical protein